MHRAPNLLHKTPRGLLRLRFAGAYTAPRGKDSSLHQHPCWEWVFSRSGNIITEIAGVPYPARRGVMLLTPPGTFHIDLAKTKYTNFFLGIEAPADIEWPTVFTAHDPEEVEQLCAALVREFNQREPEREAMVALLLNQMEILIGRTRREHQLSRAELLVTRAEQIMDNQFAQKPNIRAIARAVGASPSALRAHFSRLRRCTPLDHLQRVRVQQALVFLKSSDLTLEAIASLCGYDSASHLSRHVRRFTGKTPGKFRHASIEHPGGPELILPRNGRLL